MATAFIQSIIFTKSYVLTSEARSIVATTDKDSLSVSLSCAGVTFFNASLYAYDGKVELLDPGALIENFFIAHQLICEQVTISFDSTSAVLKFVYCENEMPASFNPAKVLLLSSLARRVHKDSQVTVAALPADSDSTFVIKAVGHDELGKIASVSFNYTSSIASSFHISFYVSLIILKATGGSAPYGSLDGPPLVDVMYFSIEYDSRQIMCYLTPAKAYLAFRFRNIFNVPEVIDIEGSMVTKSETSRKDAVCAGDIVKYDRKTDRTYQVVTGPLPADEVESLAQLLSSHSIQLFANGVWHDAVIEEASFENSTEDDTLASVKFTWRFKGRRPVKFNSSIFGIPPSGRKIFSDEYSPEYE